MKNLARSCELGQHHLQWETLLIYLLSLTPGQLSLLLHSGWKAAPNLNLQQGHPVDTRVGDSGKDYVVWL